MFGLKTTELLLIFVVILLLFGATRLPQLGSSLGAAIRNFKKGFGGEDEPEPKKSSAGTLASASGTDLGTEPAKSTAPRND
ncbi:MAG: twin-arginine translocase TatA/TatE family subunit [Myxococcaceae bacterium]|nr:twin-arginine translocase TatA/TatE family subunit [Myxococcaceae bacterium]